MSPERLEQIREMVTQSLVPTVGGAGECALCAVLDKIGAPASCLRNCPACANVELLAELDRFRAAVGELADYVTARQEAARLSVRNVTAEIDGYRNQSAYVAYGNVAQRGRELGLFDDK